MPQLWDIIDYCSIIIPHTSLKILTIYNKIYLINVNSFCFFLNVPLSSYMYTTIIRSIILNFYQTIVQFWLKKLFLFTYRFIRFLEDLIFYNFVNESNKIKLSFNAVLQKKSLRNYLHFFLLFIVLSLILWINFFFQYSMFL